MHMLHNVRIEKEEEIFSISFSSFPIQFSLSFFEWEKIVSCDDVMGYSSFLFMFLFTPLLFLLLLLSQE